MRKRVFWVVAGGFSFWFPAVLIPLALGQAVNLWTLNLAPLVGLGLAAAGSWAIKRRPPRWGWVLAGIYILGPVSMLARSALLGGPSSPGVPGETMWMLFFCLFPPMTLWVALLNGMIFSVLAATLTLPFLAAFQAKKRARSHGTP